MPSPLERLGHGFLCGFSSFSRPERADPNHQIQSQLDPELVRLACRELSARFVGSPSSFPQRVPHESVPKRLSEAVDPEQRRNHG